ncbi:hypothetical protein LTS15_003349 [Exophiala xenobiotica]|nr:hypothetical protein LTS15_003349 [Exophiala xenobiotica]
MAPHDYSRQINVSQTPLSVQQVLYDLSCLAQDLRKFDNWVVQRDEVQVKGIDLIKVTFTGKDYLANLLEQFHLAIYTSNCRAYALVSNLHRVAKHATRQLFRALETEMKRYGVLATNMTPEPGNILAQFPALRAARTSHSLPAEPDVQPQLWVEFQTATDEILRTYETEMLQHRQTLRDQNVSVARLRSHPNTAPFAELYSEHQLTVPAPSLFLIPELIFKPQAWAHQFIAAVEKQQPPNPLPGPVEPPPNPNLRPEIAQDTTQNGPQQLQQG